MNKMDTQRSPSFSMPQRPLASLRAYLLDPSSRREFDFVTGGLAKLNGLDVKELERGRAAGTKTFWLDFDGDVQLPWRLAVRRMMSLQSSEDGQYKADKDHGEERTSML